MINVLIISLVSLIAILILWLIIRPILDRNGTDSWITSIIVPTVIIFLISAVLLTIGTMLIRDPQSVYVRVNWLWILFGGIAFSIFLFFIGLLWTNSDDMPIQVGATQILVSIIVFVMMILGIRLAPKGNYEIAVAEDINLIRNLPSLSGKTYYFSVVDDIDFSEFTFKKTYSSGDSYIVIEGNGYSWYNIDYEVTADRDIVFLDPNTAPTNNARSKIQNLSIVGSVFSIIPNNYDDKNHEGLGVDFEIINKNILLENVIIDAIVYCGEAEANVRSSSPSYVDKIYPSTTYDEENNVNINIRVME